MEYRIGIDVDGVLCDFVNGFCDLAKRKLDKDVCRTPNRWEWADDHLTQEEQAELWKHIKENPGWWGTLNSLDQNSQTYAAMDKWTRLGYDLYAITTRPGVGAQLVTADWIMSEFGFPLPVIVTRDAIDKARIAYALRLTHFVDDNVDNCREVFTAVPTARVRLYNASHNRNAGAEWESRRIYKLEDLVE